MNAHFSQCFSQFIILLFGGGLGDPQSISAINAWPQPALIHGYCLLPRPPYPPFRLYLPRNIREDSYFLLLFFTNSRELIVHSVKLQLSNICSKCICILRCSCEEKQKGSMVAFRRILDTWKKGKRVSWWPTGSEATQSASHDHIRMRARNYTSVRQDSSGPA
jgi:hypothetical protein